MCLMMLLLHSSIPKMKIYPTWRWVLLFIFCQTNWTNEAYHCEHSVEDIQTYSRTTDIFRWRCSLWLWTKSSRRLSGHRSHSGAGYFHVRECKPLFWCLKLICLRLHRYQSLSVSGESQCMVWPNLHSTHTPQSSHRSNKQNAHQRPGTRREWGMNENECQSQPITQIFLQGDIDSIVLEIHSKLDKIKTEL